MNHRSHRISVVTPTLRRPIEVRGLLENLAAQTTLPYEVVLVDGAPAGEHATERVVKELQDSLPYALVYIRKAGGTAIQRNTGVEVVGGDYVAFVDDDVRLEPDFFQTMLREFGYDDGGRVGGIVGYRINRHFRADERRRWRWYRRLRLLHTFDPGRYDFACGYPINANLQAPFTGTRRVDFMTTSCAVWRKEVFERGLRFDPFFTDYGILEDAHFSLRAARHWELQQCGDARCLELHSPNSRENGRKIGYKSVVNYHYVFRDIVHPLTWLHHLRFWRFQAFELLRVTFAGIRGGRVDDLRNVQGRLEGMLSILRGKTLHKRHA